MGTLAIISDTHLPKGRRRLPDPCMQELLAAETIVHAGDFSTESVLIELQAFAPVHAVHGNVDEPPLRARLPEALTFEHHGVRIGVTHDAGPRAGRLERLRRRFPDAAAVIFGHSHIPLHERTADGFQIFNPGSPTDRRSQPAHTMGVARVDDGVLVFSVLELG